MARFQYTKADKYTHNLIDIQLLLYMLLTGQEAATMNHQSFNPGEASAPVKDGPVITTRKNYSNAKPMPIRHKTENDLVSDLFLFINMPCLQLGFNFFWA